MVETLLTRKIYHRHNHNHCCHYHHSYYQSYHYYNNYYYSCFYHHHYYFHFHYHAHSIKSEIKYCGLMLQLSLALFEMASLRLPESDETEIDRRRPTGQQVATNLPTTENFSGLATTNNFQSAVDFSAIVFTEYVNGSMQEILLLTSTKRPLSGYENYRDYSFFESSDGFYNFSTNNFKNLSIEQFTDRWWRHSIAMSVVYFVAYFIVFFVGLIGNLLVIAVVYRSPRMRTVTNFFIVNLAVADILVISFCLPATLMSNLFVRKYIFSII